MPRFINIGYGRQVRGRLLVDLLQGVQLRAKVGIPRQELLKDVRSYVPLILGEQM